MVYLHLLDARDWAFGLRAPLTPPRRKTLVGGGDFHQVGRMWLGRFQDMAGLEPHEDVLDIGCGIGRMAVPLAGYLDPEQGGSYEGLDVTPRDIEWCQKNIGAEYPHFRFTLADIYNGEYNPSGAYRASEYTFPYKDRCLDFAFMTSVMTHLLPADMENYLRQTARVLKPGGRCLITFFLLNEQALAAINAGKSNPDFRYEGPGYRTFSKEAPEYGIAYDEEYVRSLYAGYGLQIKEPVRRGRWTGIEAEGNQDAVLAIKI